MTDFDSRPDTYEHIGVVRANLTDVVKELLERALNHDATKMMDPELAIFNEFTPKLAEAEYGSAEYKAHLKAMGPGLQHHYAWNSHHPEHYDDGAAGMDLLDVIEMVCDWEAAARRMKDGNIRSSLELNFRRFEIEPQLASIIRNTIERMWPT